MWQNIFHMSSPLCWGLLSLNISLKSHNCGRIFSTFFWIFSVTPTPTESQLLLLRTGPSFAQFVAVATVYKVGRLPIWFICEKFCLAGGRGDCVCAGWLLSPWICDCIVHLQEIGVEEYEGGVCVFVAWSWGSYLVRWKLEMDFAIPLKGWEAHALNLASRVGVISNNVSVIWIYRCNFWLFSLPAHNYLLPWCIGALSINLVWS